MKPHEIRKTAEEFGISIESAVRMRVRYLVQLCGQWDDYLDEKTDIMPESTAMDAILEINELRKYEKNYHKINTKNSITDEMISAAREYPVASLVELSRGKTLCFVHQEKTPSMQLHEKRNRLHCFGCGWDGGPIDILMERDGRSFIDAVKELQ